MGKRMYIAYFERCTHLTLNMHFKISAMRTFKKKNFFQFQVSETLFYNILFEDNCINVSENKVAHSVLAMMDAKSTVPRQSCY